MSEPNLENVTTEQTLLIDGDILLYRFSCTNAFTIQWGDGVSSDVFNLESAQFDASNFITRMQERLHTEDVVVVFSGKNNFRYGVLPSYKHNRVGLEKPALYAHLKAYLSENFITKEKEGLEGDDVMGILATRWPGRYILATIDKDLRQIPGEMFDWNKDLFTNTTVEEADRFFYKQILMGDSCDGYTGCPGIGPKRAEAILEPFLSGHQDSPFNVWELVVQTYQSKGLTEADALQQARVARILRASDYDFNLKRPVLWTPTSNQKGDSHEHRKDAAGEGASQHDQGIGEG